MAETASEPTSEPTSAETATRKLYFSDQGYWAIAWRQFSKDRVSMAGLAVCALLAALAVFAPFLANGLPYTIRGVLTNFYSNNVAAFRDYHNLYRERAAKLGDTKLRPGERAELALETEIPRRGLPRILDRLPGYMKPEDARAFRDLANGYEKLLDADPTKLDVEDYDKLGGEIDERFGALAFEPAIGRLQQPLLAFQYNESEGRAPIRKRALDAAEDARNAVEDKDQPALAAATKKLEELAPELDAIAKRVVSGGEGVALFFPDESARVSAITRELGTVLHAYGDPAAAKDAKAAAANDARFQELSSKVDEYAKRVVPPERQRLPRTTLHPIFEYFRAVEVGFMVLYLTVLLVIAARKKFIALTADLPLDPGDIMWARLGMIVAPGLIAGLAWAAIVPSNEPPSDDYYKAFARSLAARPDPESKITFAPVPFGENENVQEDKVSPPTWLEGVGHMTARLLAGEDKLPAGIATREELSLALDAAPGTHEAEKATPDVRKWADEICAKRLSRYRYHWLGTDKGGRDILSRLIIGSQVSLSVGFVAVALNMFFGVILGAVSGFFGGWVDASISRFTEIVMCIPTFFLILTLIVIRPPWLPAIWGIMLVLGLIGWTTEMRLVRGEFLRLVNLDFVTAGRALGFTNARVIFRHVLPNALAPILVAATFGIAGAILTESALSFLGFGVQPPAASWGSVLNEAFGAEKEMWWVTIFPGFMIFITITAYNLVGEGFRDATDPRLRK